VASSGLLAVQGLGFLVAGAVVDAGVAPTTVVGCSGAVGTLAVLAAVMYRRSVDTRLSDDTVPAGSPVAVTAPAD